MRKDMEEAIKRNKEANRFFSTIGFKGMLKGIEKYLNQDEKVCYIRNANVQINALGAIKPNSMSIKGKQPALLAITTKRVMVYHKMFPNEKMEQFPISEIQSYDFNKGLTSSKFRITALTKSVDIDLTYNIKEAALLSSVIDQTMPAKQG